VPAYWAPSTPSGEAEIDSLARTLPTKSIVVLNGVRSAPQIPYDQAWADTFRSLSAAGIVTVGYVDTGYLGINFGTGSKTTRPDGPGSGGWTTDAWMRQIEKDVDDWYATYGSDGVGGIFLDQTVASCGPNNAYVGLYQQISDYIKGAHPNAYIVMN